MRVIRWLIGSLLLAVFAVFTGIVWLAYQEDRQLQGEPPLIRASTEPYRRAPSERGGLAVLNESSAIVRALDRGPEPAIVERILPAPAPAPKSTAELVPANALADSDVGATLAREAAAATAEVAPQAIAASTDETLLARLPEALSSPDVEAEPRLPRLPEPTGYPEPAAGSGIQSTEPPTAQQPLAASRDTLPVVEAPLRVATAAPDTVIAQEATSTGNGSLFDTQALVELPPSLEPGSYKLQLAAFRSEEQALAASIGMQEQVTALIAGVRLEVVRAETDSGVYFRVQTEGGTSSEDASLLCEAFKQVGGECFVKVAGS